MKHSNLLRRVLLLGAVLLQCALFPTKSSAQEPSPTNVVQELYREVVARHPMGVPDGPAKAAIWPLLSQRLIRAFETRNACDRDWVHRHHDPDHPAKPPGFYEDGLFSGSNEQGYVNGAVVGSAKAQVDGSYLVYVKLWSYLGTEDLATRTGKIYRWRVAARVTSEHGRFVVDDILGLKGTFEYDKSVYMSKLLRLGCNGTHSTFR